MARAPRNAVAKTENKTTALANWEEELAKQADAAASQEASTGGGQFFSMKSGVLSFGGNQLPNNEMAVVILDSIIEYTYYEGDYDADNPQSPACFAFGRDENTMTWHENSLPEYAGKLCKDSDINQWGSAEKGRGKAAKNTRRLGMISAGQFKDGKFIQIDDPDHFESAVPAFMKLPVTSINGYGTFVKQVAGTLRRPPHGIFTRVKVVPDPKSQFKVMFEALGLIPGDLMPTIMKRHEEVKSVIDFPYAPFEERPQPPARGRGQTGGRAQPKRNGKY